MAVDSSGNAYVTRWTASTDFPTINAVQAGLNFHQCFDGGLGTCSQYVPSNAFLTKLSSTGAILFSAYWGGIGSNGFGYMYDFPAGIAVDSTGVVICGTTDQSDFPGQPIGNLSWSQNNQTGPGLDHVFVTKFSLTGQVIYSRLLGGSGDDQAKAIAVDSSHAAYITGYTQSHDFPMVGSWRTQYSGGEDAFVAKIDPWGNLVNSAYIGGGSDDFATGIAVDASDAIWITGRTNSADFPIAGVGPVTFHLPNVFFVSRINSTFDGFFFSTVFGGGDATAYPTPFGWVASGANSIAVPGTYAFVTGAVTPNAGFPTTAGAFQATKPTPTCAFVAVISPYGQLMSATYLGGGNGSTLGSAIAVNGAGIYVSGRTSSTTFPGAPAITPNPTAGFLVKFKPQLNAIYYTQLLGAAINGVAVYQPYSCNFTHTYCVLTYPKVYTAGYRYTGGTLPQNMDAFVVKLDETPGTPICCAILP